MNRILTPGARKISFALAFITLVFIGQAKAQVVDQILNKVEAHRKALTTLRSDIKKGKYDSGLKEWTYETGKIMFAAKSNKLKQGLFRIDWKEPTQDVLSVIKGKYYAYSPNLKTMHTGAANAKKAEEKGGSIFSILSMSKSQLNAGYKPEYDGEEKLEGGIPTWHLKFIPKTASQYKSIDIWVDGNGMVLQVKIIPKSGDESNLRLTNLEKNIQLKTDQFVVKVPPDTKIIRS